MMLPRKIQRNEHYGMVFTLWGQLIDYLSSQRLIAGNNITLEKRSAGIIINSKNNSISSPISTNSYSGFFKLQIIDTTLSVTDGFDTNNTNCGKVFVNLEPYDIATASLNIGSSSGISYVYLEAVFESTPTIIISSVEKENDRENATAYYLLGRIKIENEVATINQEHQGGDVYMWIEFECEEDE